MLHAIELAEYALNRSVVRKDQDEPDSGIQPVHTSQMLPQTQTSVKYDFDLLDDLLPEGAAEDNKVIQLYI